MHRQPWRVESFTKDSLAYESVMDCQVAIYTPVHVRRTVYMKTCAVRKEGGLEKGEPRWRTIDGNNREMI